MTLKTNDLAAIDLSHRKLLRVTFYTLVSAIAITVTFVLPAEYGVDPIGFGTAIGLTRLAEASTLSSEEANQIAIGRTVKGVFPAIPSTEQFDYFNPEVLSDPYSRSHDQIFLSQTLEISLDVGEQVEIKAVLKQGDALVYRWQLIDGQSVYSDFHADPQETDKYPERYWIRYLESEKSSATGSLVAPFDGNHGWYWLNIEEQPIKIKLEVHGFYESITEIARSYQ